MKLLFAPLVALSALAVVLPACQSATGRSSDGSVLPFPTPPSASVAGRTLAESSHTWRRTERRLPEDAPNIVIVMLDDSGFGQSAAFGGEIEMPTIARLAQDGIAYNAFHTTAMCSPTRAALLTGRNHHRVGNGQIAEFANDFDGYSGVIPRSSATFAEVLREYGYATAAFGKWHNTPIDTLGSGPYGRFPTGHGFDYFYGFIAGETSQWEPVLWENTTPVDIEHPDDHEDYHLTEDMAEKALTWMRRHRALHGDRPFLVYWTPGAVHGPHHVAKAWADKYAGRFDDGWDALRQRTFERQKALGWIPQNAELSPRPATLDGWEDIPQEERAFQARLMEIYAGFLEHTDAQVGKLVDGLEEMGVRDKTLFLYIQSDNGASAEGIQGSIAELNAQNGIPSTIAEHIQVLESFGGLDALGGPQTDNMYHAGWAWAGDAPFRYTKLVAGDFGGTRTPLVISWPARIEPDEVPRSQFLHVNDVAPTLYELLGITPPEVFEGFVQDPLDGRSFAATFDDPDAPTPKSTQYFEILGSRGIYHGGWFAMAFGLREPWVAAPPDIAGWDPLQDRWELYDLESDFALAHDLAGRYPEKLVELKELWMAEAAENKVLPIGAGLLSFIDPTALKRSSASAWTMYAGMTRIPEAEAPPLAKGPVRVEIDATVAADTSGVLWALGGYAGGVALFMQDGVLHYEYSALLLRRTKVEVGRIPPGDVRIAMEMRTRVGWAAPADLTFWVNGREVKTAEVERTVPLAFTASETFDIGVDLNSPVADAYLEQAPFPFTGELHELRFEQLAPAGP
jgi:arylsulfatase